MQKNRFPFYFLLALLLHFSLLGVLILWTSGWFKERPLGGGGGTPILLINVGGREGEGEGQEREAAASTPPAPQPVKKKETTPLKVEKKSPLPLPTPSPAPEKPGKEGSSSPGGGAPGEGSGEPGSGGKGGSGQGTPDGSKILSEIRRRIERFKRYPSLARLRQIEGVVRLSFQIEMNGAVQDLKLEGSSGSSLLDEEALATVRRAVPLPYYPSRIRISLSFFLENE